MIKDYFPDVALVLVEGYKQAGLPKVALYRKSHSREIPRQSIIKMWLVEKLEKIAN
ncbi:MAG: molybdopterin-guanine dinucleotide biosynthesis protein B [Geopsychrobacter sp.]|nr:molybdopterin-guanine dinucleotide biosynthesis protein B [Geopsychrobacter sp.]